MGFSIERFERAAWRRRHEPAWRELLQLLLELDANGGRLADRAAVLDAPRCTRIAAAAACLITDPQSRLSPQWVAPMLGLHRWLAAVFAAGGLGSGDALIRALNRAADDGAGDDGAGDAVLSVAPDDLVRFCLLYSADSGLPLDIGALWRHDRRLAAGLAVALVSPRLLATPAAHARRERLLPWLAEHLPQIDDWSDLPGDVLHDVYMQCSYADRADRHDVKRAIATLARRALQRRGLAEPLPGTAGPSGAASDGAAARPAADAASDTDADARRPVLLVVVEWLSAGHSIMRTHSTTIAAARSRFHVVGVGYGFAVDADGRALFDRFVELPHPLDPFEQVRRVRDEARACAADVLYMPSVGMSVLTLLLSECRVARLQAMGTGHPATSHGSQIDRVVAEHGFVGDRACFSEAVLELPADAMPYRLPAPRPPPPPRPHAPAPVRIALCATLMKLNPALLAACAEVVRRSPVAVHFHLLVGQAVGVTIPALRGVVAAFLGDDATVHPQQPYAGYRDAIESCDLFVSPFPFGNTNGVVDCVASGLVGVCRTGREVHERIDAVMFERLGWPGWLTAADTEGYIAAVIRLAAGHDERADLRARLAGPSRAAVFAEGRAEIMGERLWQAWAERSP